MCGVLIFIYVSELKSWLVAIASAQENVHPLYSTYIRLSADYAFQGNGLGEQQGSRRVGTAATSVYRRLTNYRKRTSTATSGCCVSRVQPCLLNGCFIQHPAVLSHECVLDYLAPRGRAVALLGFDLSR